MAFRFGKTESELKRGVTATEFLRYQAHLEREVNEATTDQWYAALLASLMYCLPYRVWGQDVPQEADKPSTFLLKFGTKEEMDRKEKELSEADQLQYAKLQKSIWLNAFGIDPDSPEPQQVKGVKTRVPEYLLKEHAVGTPPPPPAAPAVAQPPQPNLPPPRRRKVQVFSSSWTSNESPSGSSPTPPPTSTG